MSSYFFLTREEEFNLIYTVAQRTLHKIFKPSDKVFIYVYNVLGRDWVK